MLQHQRAQSIDKSRCECDRTGYHALRREECAVQHAHVENVRALARVGLRPTEKLGNLPLHVTSTMAVRSLYAASRITTALLLRYPSSKPAVMCGQGASYNLWASRAAESFNEVTAVGHIHCRGRSADRGCYMPDHPGDVAFILSATVADGIQHVVGYSGGCLCCDDLPRLVYFHLFSLTLKD